MHRFARGLALQFCNLVKVLLQVFRDLISSLKMDQRFPLFFHSVCRNIVTVWTSIGTSIFFNAAVVLIR